MRSSFALSEKTVIDIGADFFSQSILYDFPFVQVENVLYTHTHDDHINYTMIWERFVRRSGGERPLSIYLTREAGRFFEEFYLVSPLTTGRELYLDEKNVKFHFLELFQPCLVEGMWVTPFPASHCTDFERNGTNYLVEREESSLYYALDSGYFCEESFDGLKGRALDLLIMECTYPTTERVVKRDGGHMDLQMLFLTLERLAKEGAVTEKTMVYLSHISPMGFTHEELENYLTKRRLPCRVRVAYDGMEVVL